MRNGVTRDLHPPTRETALKRVHQIQIHKSKSVLIGPIPLPGRKGAVALSALERGGPSVTETRRGGQPSGTRPINVRARPLMVPAMMAELPKFPAMWAGAVRKGGG